MSSARSNSLRQYLLSTPSLYIIAIVFALYSGFSDNTSLKALGLFFSDAFIRIFKCISLPIISLSMIVTLSSYKTDTALKSIWQKTLKYTLATTIGAASISCLLYYYIQPNLVSTTIVPSAAYKGAGLSYLSHLSHLIPETIFSPFIEHQVISVLFLSILIGIAIRFIPDSEARKIVTHFFNGIHGLFMVITRWVVAVIPLGLFGFLTTSIVEFRGGMDLKGIGEYLMVIILANVIQGFIILPLWLKYKKIPPFKTMKAMMPALSLAFFSKSSVGTLPLTMHMVESRLNVPEKMSRIVLPLCTSINMNGCAAFIFATVIYLMQNNGIPVHWDTMALWVVVATIAAVGNAGVPMGCFFLSASLLSSMNVSITLLGVILPFYGLIDMFETALNVWSDSCVVTVLNQDVIVGETEAVNVVNLSRGER